MKLLCFLFILGSIPALSTEKEQGLDPLFVESLFTAIDTDNWVMSYYAKKDYVKVEKNIFENEIAVNIEDTELVTDEVTNKASATKEEVNPGLTDLEKLVDTLSPGQKIKKTNYSSTIKLKANSYKLGFGAIKDQKYEVLNVGTGDLSYPTKGVTEIHYDIAKEGSIVRYMVDGKSLVPLSFEVGLLFGQTEFEIPLIEKESFLRFVDRYSSDAYGGALLVDLYDKLETAEIDRPYVEKIYLTEDFKKTTQDNDYRYLLFLGIDQGNALLQVQTMDGLYAEKVINIQNDEIFFEYPVVSEGEAKEFNLFEESILTNKVQELNVRGGIYQFNSKNRAIEVGINRYKIKTSFRISGMKNMLEFENDRGNVIVSYNDESNVVLPSQEYQQYLIDLFDLGSMEENCIVEIRPSKKIKNIRFDSFDNKGKMPTDLYYFDEDGMFDLEPSELTTKAYFIGDGPGVIYSEIEYIDGKKDYLKTYCSNKTYLIEHF